MAIGHDVYNIRNAQELNKTIEALELLGKEYTIDTLGKPDDDIYPRPPRWRVTERAKSSKIDLQSLNGEPRSWQPRDLTEEGEGESHPSDLLPR
ncbi:hypothetical protein ACFSR7_15495 [Cohnella sp. GCM10020058]|uniref:hypothetical protein n=1 Tax=Cohnella sp. GCM10020058 TaxID=3317330 RepID=UPI00362F3913